MTDMPPSDPTPGGAERESQTSLSPAGENSPPPGGAVPPARRRRLFRWVSVLAVLLLAGFAAAFVAQAWLTTTAQLYIQSELADELGVPFSIERLSIRLFPSALTLHDVRVGSHNPQEHTPLLTVSTISVEFSAVSLFAGRLVVNTIIAEAPQLELTPARVTWLAQTLQRRGVDTTTDSLFIQELLVRGGGFRYDDGAGAQLNLDGVDGSVQFGFLTDRAMLMVTNGRVQARRGHWEVEADTISGKASVTATQVALRKISLKGPQWLVTLDGTVGFENTSSVQLAVTASVPVDSLQPLLPPTLAETSPEGHLELAANVTGSWRDAEQGRPSWMPLTLSGTIRGAEMAMNRQPVGGFSSTVRLERAVLTLSDFHGQLLDGDVRGGGRVDFSGSEPQSDVTLQLTNLRLGQDLAAHVLPAPMPSGRISGRLAGRGSGWSRDTIAAEGSLSFTAPTGEERLGQPKSDDPIAAVLSMLSTATVEFDWRPPRLSIHRAQLTTTNSRATVHGTFTTDGQLDAAMDIETSHIVEWSRVAAALDPGATAWWDRWVEGDGELQGSTAISGTWPHPLATVTLSAHRLLGPAAGGGRRAEIDDVQGTLLYHQETLTLSELKIRQGTGVVIAAGTVSHLRLPYTPSTGSTPTGGEPQMLLTFRFLQGNIARVLALFDLQTAIDGLADGTLMLSGTPSVFQLEGPLQVVAGDLYGQRFDHGTLSFVLTPTGMRFSDILLHRGEGQVQASGSLEFKGGYEATGSITAFPVSQMDLVTAYLPDLAGTVSGRLSASGTWSHHGVEADLVLDELTANPLTLGAGTLQLRLNGETLQITASLANPNLALSGTVHLRDDFPATATLETEAFPLVALMRPLLPSWPTQIQLVATGTGEFSGSLQRPQELQGHASFSAVQMQLADYPLTNDGPVEISIDRGTVTLDRIRFTGEGTVIGAEGNIALMDHYNTFIHGEADLAALRLFFPQISFAKGGAYLALQVTEQWSTPKIAGGITIQDGFVRINQIDQPISVSYAGLFFDGQRLVLDSLTGGIGRGTVEATGRLTLRRFSPVQYRMLVDLAEVSLTPAEGLSGTVSGTLWFQGDMEPDAVARHTLKGDVQLLRATYSKRIDLRSLLAQEQAVDTITFAPPEFLTGVTLRLHVWGGQALWVRNNVAKIPLDVDVEIRGTMEHPVLVGRIMTAGGTFTFLHTPFTVTEGSIDFIDPKETKLALDLKARTAVRDYTVDLTLTGSLNRFKLELVSDPPLSEPDILSLMTVGRTPEEVAAAGAGNVATTEAAALLVDEFIEERVTFLFDRVQLDPILDSTGITTTTKVTVGKQFPLFNSQLLVLLSKAFDPNLEDMIRLEYEINSHISVIGERNEFGRLGGDLKFRFEFR